jgi:uncharacterized protein YjdB
MKSKLLVLFSFICMILGIYDVKGQYAIDGVSYMLRYNVDSCHYEVLLIINEGFTDSIQQRIAFNANISLRYPASDPKPTIKRSYYPTGSSAPYQNITLSDQWVESTSALNPAASPGFSYVSFVPQLTGNGAPFVYRGSGTGGNLQQGDTIRLFSLNSRITNCSRDFRLYINGQDPPSNAPGMGSGNFSNGFTIENAGNQVYQNNSTQLYPPNPLVTNITTSCSNGIFIDLTATAALRSNGTPNPCQGPLSYAWTGPNSFTATTQDVSIPDATFINRGTYSVVVTDTMGCTSTAQIEAENKPNAGSDVTVCAGTPSVTLTGTQPATGIWWASTNYGSFNPGSTNAGVAQVNFSSYNLTTPSTFNYVYGVGTPIPFCTDTMRVTVNPKPVVQFIGAPTVCAFVDNRTKQLSPALGGTWVSHNPSIATVTGNTITGVTPGLVKFTFTNSTTGCKDSTSSLLVAPKPTVTLSSDTLCLLSTAILTPTSSTGNWTLSNSTIASIGNYPNASGAGTFFGLRAEQTGSTRLWFRVNQTGQASCISDTLDLTVLPQPQTFLPNPSECAGDTGLIIPIPNVAGTWETTDPLIATVSNSGVISAIAPGQTQFIFTQLSTGCKSPASTILTVTIPPTINGIPASPVCAGIIGAATLTVSPSQSGIWKSNDTTKATIDPSTGVITTLDQGLVNFTFTNTGGCVATSSNLSISPKPATFADPDSICVGTGTTLSTGSVTGVWARLATSSGIINYISGSNPPRVVGLSQGVGFMEFTASNGCKDTIPITVSPRPTITLLGQDSLCIGQTTNFDPSSGGTWSSSNVSVATINQTTGLVTSVNGGQASFTFTTFEGCASDPSDPITVIPNANITIGDATLCVGDQTFVLSDLPGGSWTSTNPTVATINEFGEVLAISSGFTQVIYTEPLLGCVTTSPTNIVVNTVPTVNASKSTICGTETSQLSSSPSTGSWSSANENIATVSGSGLVTPGSQSGLVEMTFTAQSTGCINKLSINVLPKPTISNLNDAQICIGDTTSIRGLPAGGSWTPQPTGIATISTEGIITGLIQGTTRFIYTAQGCQSDLSGPITVDGPPTINAYTRPEICIGDTTQLSANGTGKWFVSPLTSTIASVDSLTGRVTGLAEGGVFFKFVNTATGCSATTINQLQVRQLGIATISVPSICVGNSAQALPSVGGVWSSSDTSVAIILNDGTIVGKKVGTATFQYQSLATGCKTAPSSVLSVTTGPAINPPADNILCLGETTTISTVGGLTGTWTSEFPQIASIDDSGLITAIQSGSTRFLFKDASGCESELSAAVFVRPKPTISLNGGDGICIGGTTDLNANTTGSFTALNPSIATINSTTGLITGVATGTARFLFTSSDNCVADTSSDIRVGVAPDVSIIGRTTLCIGDTTNLFPSEGGVWTSSNPEVASVTNDGVVTSRAPGYATFTFTESTAGCESIASTDTLTVVKCLDPDINVTYVDVTVPGDVSTNDSPIATATYSKPPVTSKPAGSTEVLNLNPDGSYTFVANQVGVYIYHVPVCIAPIITSCPTTTLTITVLEPSSTVKVPVANTDIATTKKNTPVTLNTLANDACAYTTGCTLDASSVTIIDMPNRGNAVVVAGGDITYTPSIGLLGVDTLTYRVCVTGEPFNCATAIQIITVEDALAENSTVAADDFNTTPENVAVTGNVKDNDSDPQGDMQTVVAQTTTKTGGTLVLGTDGSYTFTPDPLFYGPISFPYETCDNGTPQACDNATLYLLVVPDLFVKVRVYLEGPLIENGGAKASDGRPLMRDNLRVSPFTGQNYIPTKDIHKYAHNNNVTGLLYDVTPGGAYNVVTNNQRFMQRGAGALTKYDSVTTTAFAASGQNAIVDWIFVELRKKDDNDSIIATRSGLLQRDGDIVDINGVTDLKFPGLVFDDYYVVVKHRNHLSVMSRDPQTPKQLTTLVNFTTKALPTYDKANYYKPTDNSFVGNFAGLAQNENIEPNYVAMWAGDSDADGRVKYDNPNDDLNSIFNDVFSFGTNQNGFLNFDFAIGYMSADYDLNSKTKFDNPDDDKNLLYGQVILYKLNTSFISNYNSLIQQLPEYKQID